MTRRPTARPAPRLTARRIDPGRADDARFAALSDVITDALPDQPWVLATLSPRPEAGGRRHLDLIGNLDDPAALAVILRTTADSLDRPEAAATHASPEAEGDD